QSSGRPPRAPVDRVSADGRDRCAGGTAPDQWPKDTWWSEGYSSTHVLPGARGITFPCLSLKTVMSSRPVRDHVPTITLPSRSTYALPCPTTWANGEATPLTSWIVLIVTLTTCTTTFFARTCAPLLSVCGTVP